MQEEKPFRRFRYWELNRLWFCATIALAYLATWGWFKLGESSEGYRLHSKIEHFWGIFLAANFCFLVSYLILEAWLSADHLRPEYKPSYRRFAMILGCVGSAVLIWWIAPQRFLLLPAGK